MRKVFGQVVGGFGKVDVGFSKWVNKEEKEGWVGSVRVETGNEGNNARGGSDDGLLIFLR